MAFQTPTTWADPELDNIIHNSSTVMNNNMDTSEDRLRGLVLGMSSVSRKNIGFITKRKWKHNGISKKGGTSQAIDAYIRLCSIASGDGWVRDFSHSDFTKYEICSDRSVYNILSLLEENGLIKIYGKKYDHYRNIQLLNTEIHGKERFLSLNRTFFQPDSSSHLFGTKSDFEIFKSLSVGPKSLMLYILYMESSVPDAEDYVFSAKVSKLASYMGVKKPTVNRYIRQINEAFSKQLVIADEAEEGQAPLSVKGSSIDNRVKYDTLYSTADLKRFTRSQNRSYGFWRDFERWLDKHNIKERSVWARTIYNPSTHGSDQEKLQTNRKNFHNALYHALIDCRANAAQVYKIILRVLTSSGYFDENATVDIANQLKAFST